MLTRYNNAGWVSSVSVVIAAGETRGTGTVTTHRDTDPDDQRFTVALDDLPSQVTAGRPGSVPVTIDDLVRHDASGALSNLSTARE